MIDEASLQPNLERAQDDAQHSLAQTHEESTTGASTASTPPKPAAEEQAAEGESQLAARDTDKPATSDNASSEVAAEEGSGTTDAGRSATAAESSDAAVGRADPAAPASEAAVGVSGTAAEGSEAADGASKTPERREIKIGSQRDAHIAEQLKARPQPLDAGGDGTDSATDRPPLFADNAAPAKFPPPRLEPKLSADMQQELDAALGDVSIDELMAGSQPSTTEELAEGAKVTGRVISAGGENVFVDLGLRHQGVVAAKQFAEQLPEVGAELTALVSRFDAEEGLYELVLAGTAVDVSAWEEVSEGMVVDAVVTGHNKGGLECEVSRLRGFMPMSQISLYRVEDVEEYVGQRFACVVTEVKPERRNLVLSRRAMLEREQAEEKKRLLEELEVGQIREGIVRRLQPFGAFVDLGGVDGLIHISQLSWDRVQDPSEVLEVGQQIKVRVNKINPETGKIGLGYRETFENPWSKAAEKYKPRDRVTGTVSRLMDFGAFVKLEPGVEGLIHISELDHKRVFRSADVVSEGQQVDVMVLSVDAPGQRIALSLKALQEKPVRESKRPGQDDAAAEAAAAEQSRRKKVHDPNLRGGINRHSDGQQFGLKW
jgi:small subunit ribosomal protein S1